MMQQEQEERDWFIKQEQDLLKQLMKDCQLAEFIAGIRPIFKFRWRIRRGHY